MAIVAAVAFEIVHRPETPGTTSVAAMNPANESTDITDVNSTNAATNDTGNSNTNWSVNANATTNNSHQLYLHGYDKQGKPSTISGGAILGASQYAFTSDASGVVKILVNLMNNSPIQATIDVMGTNVSWSGTVPR